MTILDTSSPQFAYIRELTSLASQDRYVLMRGSKLWEEVGSLSDNHLVSHLNSGPSASVFPIIQSQAQFGVLDLDNHDREWSFDQVLEAAGRLSKQLAKQGLAHRGFRSRGGIGVHLWIIWQRPQAAAAVRRTLVEALSAIGFKEGAKNLSGGTIEVFPKRGKEGSNISLPFSLQFQLLIDDCTSLNLAPTAFAELDLRRNPDDLPQLPVPINKPVVHSGGARANSELAIVDALKKLTSDDRGRWVAYGYALKAAFDEAGFDIWLEWSEKSDRFRDEEDCRRVWEGLQPRGTFTIGSIYYDAKQEG